MLLIEFVERTGYEPEPSEYAKIERDYMQFSGDKDEFCKKWKRENPTKAGELWRRQKLMRVREREEQRWLTQLHKRAKVWAGEPQCDLDFMRMDEYNYLCEKAKVSRERAGELFRLFINYTGVLTCWQPYVKSYFYKMYSVAIQNF